MREALQEVVKSRAVVVHEGDNMGRGYWRCLKDTGPQGCQHIEQARDYLKSLGYGEGGTDVLEDEDTAFCGELTKIGQIAVQLPALEPAHADDVPELLGDVTMDLVGALRGERGPTVG